MAVAVPFVLAAKVAGTRSAAPEAGELAVAVPTAPLNVAGVALENAPTKPEAVAAPVFSVKVALTDLTSAPVPPEAVLLLTAPVKFASPVRAAVFAPALDAVAVPVLPVNVADPAVDPGATWNAMNAPSEIPAVTAPGVAPALACVRTIEPAATFAAEPPPLVEIERLPNVSALVTEPDHEIDVFCSLTAQATNAPSTGMLGVALFTEVENACSTVGSEHGPRST